jgi:uncharacterized repeat protein (TIGR01451 family)
MFRHRLFRTLWISVLVPPLLGAGAVAPVTPAGLEAATPPSSGADGRKVEQALERLPLYFIENQGQADPRVSYYVQGSDTSLSFTSEGVTFTLGGEGNHWVVQQRFLGARPVKPEAQGLTTAVVSYFKGSPDEWDTGVPTYASVAYRELWPGIDLVYSGTGSRLKYSLMVKAGADVSAVRLAYEGASRLRVNTRGQLEVSGARRSFLEDAPYSYQEIDGRRIEVPTSFAAEAGGSYGFRVAAYDLARPLVIDPAVLVYAGYIGGLSLDEGRGVAVDAAGNAYVTGRTFSPETTFPDGDGFGTVGGPDTTYNEGGDAFVAKVNAAGTGLVYAGYIGGSRSDHGNGVAVDATGNAYVTGVTSSSQATFPVTVGPDLTYNEGEDAFVAKVNAAGTALVYAGYVGGSSLEFGNGVAVDAAGNAYVTGSTLSSETTFPETVGPDLTSNGFADAFVAKVNVAGTGLVYAGYIGGSNIDGGLGVAVDVSGNAYVAGSTFSSEATFPVTVGPDLTYNGGSSDAFVAKVNAAGTALLYAGYIGGSSLDGGGGVAVDALGNAYVAGSTSSSEATFPVTAGPDLTYNGGGDAFVAKVNAAGTALVYAGYLGGSGTDEGFGVAVDASANAYVTGKTESDQTTFPETVGPDLTYNGGGDAFVVKVAEVIVTPTDLSLVKADSPDPVKVGDVLTYTLTATNGGPGGASAVTVVDTLPVSVDFQSASASQGTCTEASGVVTCVLGSLANGAVATVTIQVVPQSTGTISNTATVTAVEPDPNPANNADTESTEVKGAAACDTPAGNRPKPCR